MIIIFCPSPVPLHALGCQLQSVRVTQLSIELNCFTGSAVTIQGKIPLSFFLAILSTVAEADCQMLGRWPMCRLLHITLIAS
uniref:Putative 3-hydroxyisobutyryl-CoA hydrolase 2 n=1 Tax=Rhizophora mucronata TaxID=61149 RepID=A0A2P2M4F2_RHIMU